MRALILAALAALAAGPVGAQSSHESCVDVTVGTAQSYACLNQRLGTVARQAHQGTQEDAPYNATSPGNVTGQFNQDATRERLGANFGHSVTPQRPAPAAPAPFNPR
jgi:hypothetical protein